MIEAGPLPAVRAQLTLMTVVFQNLLGNALKFTGEQPPRIVVTAERDGAFWSFSVTDNGIGIEPQYADRVFLIFQRLHDRAAYPGTGIGLAMCRKIVEYFGGRIWLDTSVADGARFCFTVPALTDDEGRADGPDRWMTLKLVDVLLVEDDEGDILMTREAFEFYKIRNPLHVVTDGEQALHFLRRTGPFADAPRPGLILLDVNLPRRQRPRGARRAEAGPGARCHPGGHADHLAGRRGHPAQLQAARERVREQAGGLRASSSRRSGRSTTSS